MLSECHFSGQSTHRQLSDTCEGRLRKKNGQIKQCTYILGTVINSQVLRLLQALLVLWRKLIVPLAAEHVGPVVLLLPKLAESHYSS
jgi:hypothetical protein